MPQLDPDKVRDLRNRRALTQQEAADLADTSLFTWQRIERGPTEVRAKTVRAVAAALEVGPQQIRPTEPETFSLAWARTAGEAEFYRRIVHAGAEDIDRLDKLSGELSRFVHRGLRRVLAERNDKPFTDHGPEPEPGECQIIKPRSEALAAEVKRRRPPFARLRRSVGGNECQWLIPPDQWEFRREQVNAFFGDEQYSDVDARGEVPLHEEDAALA